MKKRFGICLYIVVLSFSVKAQSTYPSTAYAAIGDTVYMTNAGIGSFDFTTTGTNQTWNFSTLQGNSQDQLVFRNPTQTGFSHVQWPYIYSTANANLSSTDGQSIAIGTIQTYNPNDYFKLSASVLQQTASSYQVIVGNAKISIKNTYSSPDILYKFPLTYGNSADSSVAQYATNIPGVYYNSSVINRKNIVDGYGTVITPYGTFSNALRITSTVVQKDSIVVDSIALPSVTSTYREIKWMDPSSKYPVLIVHQNKVGTQFVTSTVSYLDHKEYFQPIALFAFYPLSPVVGDTINFQNLSTNGSSYTWNFGDSSAGSANTATSYNGQYIYTTPGTYHITLKVANGNLIDSVTLPIAISGPPTASFSYSTYNDTIYFQNSSLYGISYSWNFNDPSSGANNGSTSKNPIHIFSGPGTFLVMLKVVNGNFIDSSMQSIYIAPSPITPSPEAAFTYSPVNPLLTDTIHFQNNSQDAISYSWNFGDIISGSNNISTTTNPSHLYSDTGAFQVMLIAINGNVKDTVVQTIIIKDTSTTTIVTSVQESTQGEIPLLVYPNPVKDILIVSAPGNYNTVSVYDQKGMSIFSSLNFMGTIDMTNVQQGCYILHLTKINGTVCYVKIIKN